MSTVALSTFERNYSHDVAFEKQLRVGVKQVQSPVSESQLPKAGVSVRLPACISRLECFYNTNINDPAQYIRAAIEEDFAIRRLACCALWIRTILTTMDDIQVIVLDIGEPSKVALDRLQTSRASDPPLPIRDCDMRNTWLTLDYRGHNLPNIICQRNPGRCPRQLFLEVFQSFRPTLFRFGH